MKAAGGSDEPVIEEIIWQLMRQYSTAIVLLHHAAAERLGLGPTDHKCFDVLCKQGEMTASRLAHLTGLTSGAITGVVARLDKAGFITRERDLHDKRKQILSPKPERMGEVQRLFDPIRIDTAALLESFDDHQLTAVSDFVHTSIELVSQHTAVLCAQRFAMNFDSNWVNDENGIAE